ncbi:hypothetical protein BGZ83_012071 [Gryganskiella cystojenkinii]|nr:hypothetical protein BGZ83_012071 [Gryganskiella cystojenkinii]
MDPEKSAMGKLEDASQAPHMQYGQANANFAAPVPTPVPTSFCCITLNQTDILRLIGTPLEIAVQLRPIINQVWSEGIQREQVYQKNAHEFKLISNPWSTVGPDMEVVQARRLIMMILRCMAWNRWTLLKNTDISISGMTETTLYFESPVNPPPLLPTLPTMTGVDEFFAISFDDSDLIRIMDAPAMLQPVAHAITRHWPQGIQKQGMWEGVIQIKLNGVPWETTEYYVQIRQAILQMFLNIESLGYKLYTSIDPALGSNRLVADTMFFRQVGPNWRG